MAMRDIIRRKSDPETIPTRFEAPGSFGALQRQMNRLFDDFFRGWPGLGMESLLEAGLGFVPGMDVSETNDTIKVEADLPGIDEKDIEVTLSADGEMLTVKGERKYEQKQGRSERAWGSFERSISLPAAVQADKVEAHFKNGVLTVLLPKSAEGQQAGKKIEIKPD
jgi:HSP20 family protein